MKESHVAVLAAVISACAAIAAGIISAAIAWSLSIRARSQKIAEFRQAWIDDLRTHLAEFVGVVHRIKNESLSDKPVSAKALQLEQLNADLMRIESFISLKLNHEEAPSGRLIGVIRQARGAAAYMSHNPSHTLSLRIDDHLNELDPVSRIVLKWEWNRVKDEIKSVGKRERRRHENELLVTLNRIPNSVEKHVMKGIF
jgi:hypothetical protein